MGKDNLQRHRPAEHPVLWSVLGAAGIALALAACATAASDPLAFYTRQWEDVLLADEDGHPMIVPNGQLREVTAICRDDWFSYAQERSGACVGHGGVREWVNEPVE